MSGEAKRIPEYKIIKCENPNIIYNPYLIPLLQKYRCYTIHNITKYLPSNYDFNNIYRDVSYKHFDINTLDDINTCNIVDTETGDTYPLYYMVPCRKCNCCKHTNVQEWVTRAQMECSTSCSVPYFITLTYNNDNLPENNSVDKKAIQDFLKRLRIHFDRKHVEHNIRYACCGEYGAKFGRPHYHIILWNMPNCYTHLEFIDILQTLWTFGFVQCKPASSNAIAYVMKYIKKDSNIPSYYNSNNELVKCEKPFFLSSRNKALGLQYLHDNFRFLINNPTLQVEILDPYSGNIMQSVLPHYLISKLYPLISSVIPRYVRYAYKEMCENWQILYNSGYPMQDFRYHIIREKFSFLPTPIPNEKLSQSANIPDICRKLNECIDICLNYTLPQKFIDDYIRTLNYKDMVKTYAENHPFTLENLHSFADKCQKKLNNDLIKQLNYDVPF